jgi:translocation and assembly module TamB
MTDGANLRRRLLWRYLLASTLAGLLILAGLAWYVSTDSFQAMVKGRLIRELEKVTGGRVDIGSFHTSPFRLRVEIRNITVHGREAPGEAPYARVESAVAVVKIVSSLGAEIGFNSLVLEHPVFHVIVYPDGTTNQPVPKSPKATRESPVEQLFQLSIGRMEVRQGEVIWNNEKIPLDFVANDVSAEMTYSLLHRQYTGRLLLGKATAQLKDYRPVAWMCELYFTLGRNSIQVQSLKINAGGSRLQGTGQLKDFTDPKIEGTYDLRLNLEQAAAVFREPALRRGIVEAQGRGTWSLKDFSSSGKFSAKDLDWRDRNLSVSNAGANMQFTISPRKLLLSQIQGRLLGGSVTGDAEITDWLHPQPETQPPGKKPEGQRGTIQLRVRSLSAGALAAAVSTRSRPFEKMNLAGDTNGTVDVHWKGAPRNAEAQLALDVMALAASPKQMPLSGRVRAAYRPNAGEVDVAELHLNTRSSSLDASGKLASAGSLKLNVTTSDLSEWQSILLAFGQPERIPVVLRGNANFTGTASGRLSAIALTGSLRAQDFDYLMPATARTPPQTVHWDSLSANVQLSSHLLAAQNGLLQRGDSAVNFNFRVSLDGGRIAAQSPLRARVEMQGIQIAELLGLAGYDPRLHGTMNLQFRASGTWANPEIAGQVELANAELQGLNADHLKADLQLTGSVLNAAHLELTSATAHIGGSASYDLSNRVFHFDLNGANFDINRLPHFSREPSLAGQVDFTAQGSGTWEQPMVNATLRLRDLTLDQERAGDFTLQVSTHGGDMHLSGRSQFGSGEFALDGDVNLRGDWPSALRVHFSHLDADSVLRAYLQGRLTGHSVTSGDLEVQGPLRQPGNLTVAGSLSELSVNIESVKLNNQGPVSFTVKDREFRLNSFHMVGDDTDFSASGTVQFAGENSLNLQAQGHANLKLIETYDSEFTSSGTVTLDMTASGLLSRPVLKGRLEVTNAAIAHLDLPTAFSEINGALTFNQSQVQIETLSAHTGGGLVSCTGTATWYNRQLNFDLKLQEKDVRLRYPPGISSTANADLHFVGSPSASTLSGDITVTKLSVMPGFDFGAYLARSARTATLPVTDPILNRIRLDVHIVTTPELQMQTAVVRLSGDADLRLRGTAAKPVILGRADVLEGQVYFNGTKYELERGEVSFSNPVTTTPLLDLQATTHVRDYDITLVLSGEPDKLKITYRSEPPLPESDIITLLALGRTTEESAQLQQAGQSSFTQDASSAIINQALNATISNRVQRLFGVSRIKVDPEGLNTETTVGRGPLVTIEQQVANNLTLTYSTSVEQAAQQIIQVEYNLSHNVSIIAVRDQNGVVSFDLKIRRRKR